MIDAPRIDTLAQARVLIDAIDVEMIDLLARRTAIVARVAQIKHREGLPARLHDRVWEVLDNVVRQAAQTGVDPGLVERLWREMIEHFIAQEEQVLGKPDQE